MTELVDPQLAAFFAANPEILPPGPIAPSARVPAWYDNTVIELAGAIVAMRGLVALSLARGNPPPVGQAQALAGQAWRHHAPTWLRFTAPAIEQAYRAGRITGMTGAELEAMATDYAEGLGEYLSDTSAEALAEGFETQLAGRWDASLAWHRVSAGYGLDTPGMRSYVRAVLAQPEGQRDLVAPAARTLADRLILERAQRVAENEAWTASQAGLATSWLIRQRRGDLPAGVQRRWRTRRRETVCAVCGPMDGVIVDLDQPFVLADGTKLLAPAAHPGCQCTQDLVEPVSKAAPATAAAGIALVAADTGRVLMLQRAHDPKDRNGGLWELPGGCLEPGEQPYAAARREWQEEVHQRLPSDVRLTSSWNRGVYQGFVLMTDTEAAVQPHRRGRVTNPDDPDGDAIEAFAWWDPKLLAGNPSVRPELRASLPVMRRALARRTRVAKAKKLDDGTLDPYDRTKKGQFARHEERTRVVTHLAEPLLLTPEAQAALDSVKEGVVNPFAAPAKGNPFAKSPFASAGANPFQARANPFAAPAKNPFAAPAKGGSPFDLTKKPSANQKQFAKRKVVIHHVFLPKKSTEVKEEHRAASDAYHFPRSEWEAAFEEWDSGALVQPGDKYDFNELAAQSAEHARLDPTNSPEVLALIEEALHADARFDSEVKAERMSPELIDLYAPVAFQTDDPWSLLPAIEDRTADYHEMDPDQAWPEISAQAKAIFDDVLRDPWQHVRDLDRHQLDTIYDMAGYERNEADDVAKDRIIDHVQARGIGDDSLSEAFADYVTWNSLPSTGPDGEALAYNLENATDAGLPNVRQEFGPKSQGLMETFAFEDGFHPGTSIAERGKRANVHDRYLVDHVIYRSALGEGKSEPFVTGLRELYMRPADATGHALYGGPYAEH